MIRTGVLSIVTSALVLTGVATAAPATAATCTQPVFDSAATTALVSEINAIRAQGNGLDPVDTSAYTEGESPYCQGSMPFNAYFLQPLDFGSSMAGSGSTYDPSALRHDPLAVALLARPDITRIGAGVYFDTAARQWKPSFRFEIDLSLGTKSGFFPSGTVGSPAPVWAGNNNGWAAVPLNNADPTFMNGLYDACPNVFEGSEPLVVVDRDLSVVQATLTDNNGVNIPLCRFDYAVRSVTVFIPKPLAADKTFTWNVTTSTGQNQSHLSTIGQGGVWNPNTGLPLATATLSVTSTSVYERVATVRGTLKVAAGTGATAGGKSVRIEARPVNGSKAVSVTVKTTASGAFTGKLTLPSRSTLYLSTPATATTESASLKAACPWQTTTSPTSARKGAAVTLGTAYWPLGKTTLTYWVKYGSGRWAKVGTAADSDGYRAQRVKLTRAGTAYVRVVTVSGMRSVVRTKTIKVRL